MLRPRRIVPPLLALALTVACDSGKQEVKPAPAAPAPAAAQGDDAPSPMAHGGNPHGNPHGAMPPAGGGNPHAGMPPMMGGAKKPAGPQRDITPSGEVVAETLPDLDFEVPKEWEKGTPSSSMRLSQWVLPGPGGDAELVVFRFPGGAGGIQQNLDRWRSQFQPPEGKTIDDVSTTKKIEGEGVSTTLVDLSGTYVAAMMPGSADKHDDADTRMLAAIVEGNGDPFYFKAVGPKATMDLWADAYEVMIASYASSGAGAGADAGKAAEPPAEAEPEKAAPEKAEPEKKAEPEPKKKGG